MSVLSLLLRVSCDGWSGLRLAPSERDDAFDDHTLSRVGPAPETVILCTVLRPSKTLRRYSVVAMDAGGTISITDTATQQCMMFKELMNAEAYARVQGNSRDTLLPTCLHLGPLVVAQGVFADVVG